MKTILLSVCIAVATSNAYSDAIKYRQTNGQIMITNQPVAEGSRELAVQRDDYVPSIHRQTAINDLQRQKEFLRTRESENRAAVPSSGYTGSSGNSGSRTDMTQIYGCLQKVTATFGLSPSQEAGRKVSCYSGTSGLNDDCQRSVAATMRLMVKAEPIVDIELFTQVAALREARSPKANAPRRTTSPNLLTGLLKCTCGHHITAVTGKSGRYRYYKCAARQSKGNHACESRNLPMEKLDSLIVDQLADKVCTPDRLNVLISELRKRTRNNKEGEQLKINQLNKQLAKSEQAQRNLLTAIENGMLFDEVTQKRSQEIKAERESLLVELAGVRRSVAVPVERILPSNIEAFSKAIRAKLKDKNFAKRYLQLLVDEIVVDGDTATMTGVRRRDIWHRFRRYLARQQRAN